MPAGPGTRPRAIQSVTGQVSAWSDTPPPIRGWLNLERTSTARSPTASS